VKTRRVTERGISWVEVVPWAPPAADQPIRPLTHPPAEVPLSLHGNPDGNRDAQRRRKVDELLEQRGVRPRRGW